MLEHIEKSSLSDGVDGNKLLLIISLCHLCVLPFNAFDKADRHDIEHAREATVITMTNSVGKNLLYRALGLSDRIGLDEIVFDLTVRASTYQARVIDRCGLFINPIDDFRVLFLGERALDFTQFIAPTNKIDQVS